MFDIKEDPIYKPITMLQNNHVQVCVSKTAIRVKNNLMNFIQDETPVRPTKICTRTLVTLSEEQLTSLLNQSTISKKELMHYYGILVSHVPENRITYDLFWSIMKELGYPLAMCEWSWFHEKLFLCMCVYKKTYMTMVECLIAITTLQKRNRIVNFNDFIFQSLFSLRRPDKISRAIRQLGKTIPGTRMSIDMVQYLWEKISPDQDMTPIWYDFVHLVFGWEVIPGKK